MLVYADVTDLVQQADKLKELSMVDGMTGIQIGRCRAVWRRGIFDLVA